MVIPFNRKSTYKYKMVGSSAPPPLLHALRLMPPWRDADAEVKKGHSPGPSEGEPTS